MRAIWKFEFDVADDVTVVMPTGARILRHVHAVDPTRLAVWAEVSTDANPAAVHLRVFGTGNPITTDDCEYVGTAVAAPFVWHVYQEVPF